MRDTFDWEAHRYGWPLEVIFTPRDEYKGRSMLTGMGEHRGTRLMVRVLWRMDDDDQYPGEYALGPADAAGDLLGRTWLASGDVTPATEPAKG